MSSEFRWQALRSQQSAVPSALYLELDPSALLLNVSAKAMQCFLGLGSQVVEYYRFYEYRRIRPQVRNGCDACMFLLCMVCEY